MTLTVIWIFLIGVLKQLPEYTHPKLIKYLLEKHDMKITKTISVSRLVTNYKLYYNFRGEEENGISWYDS